MDSVHALDQFGTQFESIWVGVKLSPTTGSAGYYKLHAYEIEAWTKTQCETTRMDFIYALAQFGMHFESVQVSVNFYPLRVLVVALKSMRVKSRPEIKT